jgi:hypothetical protein
MRLVTPSSFFATCRRYGIKTHPQEGGPPQCVVYAEPLRQSRFWPRPEAVELPYFLWLLLEGLDPWQACYVWPRGGRWNAADADASAGDRVRARIVAGAGVPAGRKGALLFERDETAALLTVLFAQAVFGWSVPDDLFLVPDHGRQIVWVEHHDVIHVDFADSARADALVEHMATKDYPLPRLTAARPPRRPERVRS